MLAAIVLVTVALSSVALQPPPQFASATTGRAAQRAPHVAPSLRSAGAPDARALMRIVVSREKRHARAVARRRARARAHARAKAAARQAARAAQAAQAVYSSAQSWANSPDAMKVANCESGDHTFGDVATRYNGDPYLHDGYYTGKWQIGPSEWASEGGTGFPWQHSVQEQDYRAWKLWKARGWEPWSCASIMGV